MTDSSSKIKPNWIPVQIFAFIAFAFAFAFMVPIFAFIAFVKLNNVFSFYFYFPDNLKKKTWSTFGRIKYLEEKIWFRF